VSGNELRVAIWPGVIRRSLIREALIVGKSFVAGFGSMRTQSYLLTLGKVNAPRLEQLRNVRERAQDVVEMRAAQCGSKGFRHMRPERLETGP
jgi:hypothetical protein